MHDESHFVAPKAHGKNTEYLKEVTMKGSLARLNVAWAMLVALTFSLSQSAPLNAQVTGATLTGTVTDTSGAVIPGATISIKNVGTGVVRDLTTDSAGLYTAPNLTAGSYEVSASAAGFATQIRSGLTLTVGAQQQLNLTMQVGQATQKVQVTGEAPAVQLASSEVSAQVNSTTVVDLPLNGRSWSDLAILQRGVSAVTTGEQNSGCSRGCGSQIAVAGARPQQNNYRLDGVSIMDQYNAGPGTLLGGNLGVDAIQEFSVITNNYSAEYGRTSGGVVNAITRSGTNQFHGDAYWFLRNNALDARNFFDPTIPPFRRNQFGASAGGPIQKDKTFIFGDYEGIRQQLGTSVVDLVPSAPAHSGILSTGNVTVDPEIAKALSLWPVPNAGLATPDIGKYTFASNQNTSENFFTVRADRKMSDKDSMFLTYLFDRNPQTQPDTFNTLLLANTVLRQVVVLEESHVFSSSFVNAARVGFNRFALSGAVQVGIINPAAADPSLATVPGHQGAAIMQVSGLTQNPGGSGSNLSSYSYFNMFQGYDDAFVTRGLHSIKFGGAAERDQENWLNNTQPGGIFIFGSLPSFLQNEPSRIQAAIPGTLAPRATRVSIFGGYIQDDWRFRPNLTLNLGLRYEMATVITEAQHKTVSLLHLTDAVPHTGDPYYANPTKKNFEPRVGFAWDPFRNGRTSVRGGFGVFDVLPLLYMNTSFGAQSTPFFQLGQANLGPPPPGVEWFPSTAYSLLQGNPKKFRVTMWQQNPPRTYVMQWNLDLQHQITPSWAAMVGYVGSHGVHQPFRTDEMDLVLPTLSSAGWLWPAPDCSGPAPSLACNRLNPNFGDIRALTFPGESSYDGLIAAVQKRMSHGFQAQVSFTWAKSLDTSSSTQEGDSLYNSIASLHWFDLHNLNYGLSDFNIGRTLVINGTWQVPSLKSASPLAWAANGWQLSSIFKVNDGEPFTVNWGTGGDPAGTLASDDVAYPDRLTGPGCQSLVNPGNPNNYIKNCFSVPTAPSMAFWQANCDTTSPLYQGTTAPFPICINLRGNSGRNIANGPGLANLDFSVFKNNYVKRISENFNVQFRAEFFNILNRANFDPPLTPVDAFDASGNSTIGAAGTLTATTTAAREIQFALKVIW
jgi:Carboxypeptidase regulatory-like domain/TonB dependent receptor-like, beta-barrel